MKRAAALVLSLAACSPDPPPPPNPGALRPEMKPLALLFKTPDSWTREMPSSSMRAAQYRVPDKEKQAKDAELAVFHFRMASSLEENLKRWGAQMSAAPPKGEEVKAAFKTTMGDITGTYTPESGGTPIEDARMLAAMVDAPDGPWFFKLVGPGETVGDWREEFIAMLRDARE